MQLLLDISKKSAEAGLPFLIIGGYAVMAHGFARATNDLDLLARAGDRVKWRQLLEQMGMSVYREARTFMQFNPAPMQRLPVDLMFVADNVFEKMYLGSAQTIVGGIALRVVSLLHLIALKCHAIRYAEGKQPNIRTFKDMDDLVNLIKLNRVDLKSAEVRDTILRHGTEELYRKLRLACE